MNFSALWSDLGADFCERVKYLLIREVDGINSSGGEARQRGLSFRTKEGPGGLSAARIGYEGGGGQEGGELRIRNDELRIMNAGLGDLEGVR